MAHKLTVVIVSYNVKYYLEQCLVSLRRALTGIDAEVYVVDNDSKDDSIGYLTPRFPEVKMIASRHNLGFARANNLAIRSSESEYVLLLNPDTIVGEESIRQSIAFMDAHPKAGAAGVRMLRTDGSDAKESRRGLPTPLTSFYKISGLCERFPNSRRLGRYYMSYLPWDEPNPIEVISGAYCFLRRKALDEVGLLDEDFFMYGEDVDLSYRLLKGGYENWYVPVEILHYKGESAHKSSFRYVHVFYNAMLIFFRKHYGNKAAIISLPIKAAVVVKATITLLHMKATAVHKSLGFFTRNKDTYVQYVFIGSAEAIGKCRRLCRHRGVEMEFVEGNAQTMPQGHSNMELATKQKFCVVYDVDSFSYDQIFGIFQGNCLPNTTIGTYNPTTNTIITAREVIR